MMFNHQPSQIKKIVDKMKCTVGWHYSYCVEGDVTYCENCRLRKDKEFQWLPGNEKVIDFIRWYELAYFILLYFICCLIFGWWGLLVATVINWLFHLQGGPLVDFFGEYPDKPEPEPQECSAGIKDCMICGNEFPHWFNEEYRAKHNKWYDKLF